MSGEYSPREAVEHVEHAHHELEGHRVALLRQVPLAAAIFAICAGLSSLYAGRLEADVLTLKNDAVLHEVTASDTWNQYQAESLKAHMYEISAQGAAGATAIRLRQQAATYRKEQPALSAHAKAEEKARDAALSDSTALEIRKGNLEVALALFEVAIVLTSIAAMIKRSPLLIGAGGLGWLDSSAPCAD